MENREEKENTVTKLRELYHGRFTRQEIRILLEHHNWNQEETNDFIINSEPRIVRQLLSSKTEEDIADILQDKLIITHARNNVIPTSLRLFACGTCDRSWWAKVPERKSVSSCRKCHVKYDAIPKEDEWGWAIFECPGCSNEFSGFGQMGVTESPCYNCNALAKPKEVRPPTYRKDPKSFSKHSCNAPDCQNKGHPVQGLDSHKECVHPESRRANRKKKIIIPSIRHVSTGSTVDSFAIQDDITSMRSVSPTLASIHENDDPKRPVSKTSASKHKKDK